MFDLCIKNGYIIDSCSKFYGTIYTKNEKIAVIAEQGEELLPAKTTIDANGCYVMPGFIDPHVHLNDPGSTHSEDFYTGTCSAAAGGTTTVIEHPLTFPLPDNAVTLKEKAEIANTKVVIDYGLLGALTPDNFDKTEKMMESGAVAFKAFMSYSRAIPSLQDGEMMKHMRVLSKLGRPMLIHCENESIINVFTQDLIAQGKVAPEYFSDGRPEIAEEDAVERMSKLATFIGAKVHIVHSSTPQGVDIVTKYKKMGGDLTVETCPHYLALNKEDLKRLGVFCVCKPPVRSQDTVDKLWEKVLSEEVDFIGSDHATHTKEEKREFEGDIFKTRPGMTATQTCFPTFFYEGVIKRNLDLNAFVRMSSTNAAKRYGLYPNKGSLDIGTDADIVIIDPAREYTIKVEDLHYMCKWSPYEGRNFQGAVTHTIVRSNIVCQNNKILAEKGSGRQLFAN